MYASLLYDVNPQHFTVIADRERRKRYSASGVLVNGRRYDFPFRDPSDQDAPADLLLVAVKQHHLDATLDEIESSIGPGTTILSLLNGVTSEEIIGARYGMDRLLYSFCVGTDATREGCSVRFAKVGTIVFGERTNELHSDRVEATARLFDRARIPYAIPNDMIRELWWKFMMNVGINPLSAILRAPYGVFQRSGEARSLFAAAGREAVAMARAEGIDLADEEIDRCFEVLGTLSPDGKTSMFQDVEAGRKTEIELFAGTVVELGRKHGIATPVNEMLLGMIRVIEQTGSPAT